MDTEQPAHELSPQVRVAQPRHPRSWAQLQGTFASIAQPGAPRTMAGRVRKVPLEIQEALYQLDQGTDRFRGEELRRRGVEEGTTSWEHCQTSERLRSILAARR